MVGRECEMAWAASRRHFQAWWARRLQRAVRLDVIDKYVIGSQVSRKKAVACGIELHAVSMGCGLTIFVWAAALMLNVRRRGFNLSVFKQWIEGDASAAVIGNRHILAVFSDRHMTSALSPSGLATDLGKLSRLVINPPGQNACAFAAFAIV